MTSDKVNRNLRIDIKKIKGDEKTVKTNLQASRRRSWLPIIPWALAYALVGYAMQALPHPMFSNVPFTLNIVIPVVAGYLHGSAVGALTGLLGTLLSFAFKLPIYGPDLLEIAALFPNILVGGLAGWHKLSQVNLGAVLGILIGHMLTLAIRLLIGLLPASIIQEPLFWNGLLAELAFEMTLAALLVNLFTLREGTKADSKDARFQRYLLLCGIEVAVIVLLSLGYLNAVPLALDLFILPIILAALLTGPIEALSAAVILSVVLGSSILRTGIETANHETFFIFMLNLVALTIGVLADKAKEQSQLATTRLHEIQQAYAVLVDTNRIKDQMIQNVSHELRTPLSIILGYAELLNTETWGHLSTDQVEAMHVIKQNAVRLSNIVEQVTMIDDLREGRLTWHPTSLDTLIHSIVDFHKSAALQQQCTLSVKMEKDIPVVNGDALYLGRAIEALLDNAIKFSPEGGDIEIKTWTEQGKVFVSVQDHGIGISEEQKSKLFKCFSQIDGSAARRFGGLGTGLALVKEVVQAHKGEIWMESAPGSGSTFGFWVPVQRKELQLPQNKAFL